MDHACHLDRPFHALSPALAAPAARIASFLASGGRAVMVSGPRGCGKSALLDVVLAGMAGRVTRVQNRLPGPLALSGILRQIGDPAQDDGDERALFFRTVAEQAYDDYSAVLAVDDAHTLTSFALSTLARVPGLGGPDLPGMILVLAGEPALLEKLDAPGLDLLRNSRRTLMLELPQLIGVAEPPRVDAVSEPAGVRPSACIDAGDPAPVAPVQDARRRGFGVPALLLAGTAGATLMLAATYWIAAPMPRSGTARDESPLIAASPLDASKQATASPQASGEVAPEPPVPSVSPVPEEAPAPEPQPGADAALRREFDAFLNRAGRDTAKLTPAARQVLFLEYLQWQARKAGNRSAMTGS